MGGDIEITTEEKLRCRREGRGAAKTGGPTHARVTSGHSAYCEGRYMQSKQIADLIERAEYDGLSSSARLHLKIRVLDSLGCAIGALGSSATRAILDQIHEFGGAPLCSLIGGQKTSPDRRAFSNSALGR